MIVRTPEVFHEMCLLAETTEAEHARVGADPGVGAQVNVQVGLGGEEDPTHRAPWALLTFVIVQGIG